MKQHHDSNEESSDPIILMSRTEQKAKIQEFLQYFTEGKAALEKAGKIIVELVDSDPYAYSYIEQECPEISPQLLRIFEDIGRGKVLPSLAFDNSRAAQIMRRLPLQQQARLEVEPVPLIVRTVSGELDVRLVKLSDMTKDQLAQAVDKDRLRTEGQQRAMLDEQAAKAAIVDIKATASVVPWTIKGGIVTFREGAKADRKQLAQLLAQLG